MRNRFGVLCLTVLVPLLGATAGLQSPSVNEQLSAAAAEGDVAAVTDLLAKGADVNYRNPNRGATPLYSAVEHGKIEVLKLLLARGGDPDVRDFEWGRTPLRIASTWTDPRTQAMLNEMIAMLLDAGAGQEGESLDSLIARKYFDAARRLVAGGKVLPSYLNIALAAAKSGAPAEFVDFLISAGAKDVGPMDTLRSPVRLKAIAGVYRSQSGDELTLGPGLLEDELLLERAGKLRITIYPIDLTWLRSHDMAVVVTLQAGLPPPGLTLRERGGAVVFTRVGDAAPTRSTAVAPARPAPAPAAAAPRATAASRAAPIGAGEWASFRGPSASGIAANSRPPTSWNGETGVNIKWKVPIPGLAHSSPIVWGNRIFVTTAVPQNEATPTFIPMVAPDGAGLFSEFGDRSVNEDIRYSWRVFAIDKETGKTLWERAVREGLPRTRRHKMQTQANSTPATDGTHVVAFFGSEGLYCFNVDGTLVWQKDLGTLRAAYVMDPTYEWNTANSPIIYNNRVILQVDKANDAFIAAFDIKTGAEVWRTAREEVSSFSTPMIYEGATRTELVTVASNFARGYDPDTGKELWRFGRQTTHATPVPIAGLGLIFVANGTGSTIAPIYALRPGAVGDITLSDDQETSESVVWSKRRGGPYMSSPILYGDLLYVNSEPGVLTAYQAESGEQIYRHRLPSSGLAGHNYTASAVAADGKLYFASADGDVVVIRAGRTYDAPLAVNPMGEPILATPAISGNMLIIRTQGHLFAVAETPAR